MKTNLAVLTALLMATVLISGCASTSTKTTTNGTNTVTSSSSHYDPLVGKQVLEEDTGFGVNVKTAGGSATAPFNFRLGFFRVRYFSNPTGTQQIYAAPFTASNHGSSSWVSQSANENTSTATNLLPGEAYVQPVVSPANPLSTSQPQTKAP